MANEPIACSVCQLTRLAEQMCCSRNDCPAKRRRNMLVSAAKASTNPMLSKRAEAVANAVEIGIKPWTGEAR